MKKLTFMIATLLAGVLSYAALPMLAPLMAADDEGTTTTEATATWYAAEQGYADGDVPTDIVFSSEDITGTFAKGSGTANPTFAEATATITLNQNNTFSINAAEGATITKVVVYHSSYADGLKASTGTFTDGQDFSDFTNPKYFHTWEGTATELTFYNSAKSKASILSMEVTYQKQSETPEEPVVASPFDNVKITPADGSELDAIESFTLDFTEYESVNGYYGEGIGNPYLVNDETNETTEGTLYDPWDGTIQLNFDEITTAGSYTLVVPAACIDVNDVTNPELTFHFTVKEQEVVGPEDPTQSDELVQLPEGVTAEEYQYKSVKPAESIYPAEDITATVQVAFDGNDVYVQGLSRDYADGWVKGVRNGETITFAKKQYVGLDEQSILGTVVGSYKVYFSAENDVVFTYDETNNKLTTDAYVINELMADGGYTTTENYTAVEIFKDGGEQPIVEPVEAKDYKYEAQQMKNYNWTAVERDVKVSVDGNVVKIQGLAECQPEAWVEGTLEGDKVTFEGGQQMGSEDVIFEPDHANVVFTYNAEADEYTLDKYELQNGSQWEQYQNVRIYIPEEKPFDVMDYVAIDPEEGEIDAIGAFTVTFGDYAVTRVDPTAVATLKNNTTEEENFAPVLVVANKKVMLSYEESTTPGEYTLTIPAGSLTLTVDEETVEVPELTFNYSIVAPLVLSWTIDPEEAENLESLGNHFALNFVDGSVSRIDYTKDLTLTFNGETEMIEAAASEEDDDVNLLEFKTMSLNTAGTKADIYFGKMTDFDYTEEGTYVLTIPAGIFQNKATGEELAEMTFTWVVGDGTTPIEEDQLVEVPAGVELEDWHIEATYYTSQGANDINEPNKVAFDGDDVYVQGLAYYFPEAWVKGTIVNGQAVFASGQFVGEDDNGKEYLNGATVDAENSFVYQDSYVFDYDVEAQKLTLAVDNGYLTECSEKTSISAWGYYSNLEIIKGEAVQPEVVVAPENLVTEDYIFTSQELSFDEETEDPIYEDYEAEIKVGFDGNDVYVQGLCADFYLPEAWVKGEKNGSTVTFTTGQYFGQVNNQYDMFFVGYGESGIEDVVMTYDEATGEFTTDNWIFINGKPNTIYYYTIYTSNKFTKAGSSTAISSINADEQNAVYFDAMGRRTNAQAKGLLIKQVRMADGTVKTVKMASK